MPLVQRAILLLSAAAMVITALGLVIQAGLPERATYSGRILPGELPVAPELNALAPSFRLPTLDGTVNLLELRGKPVVINFWATWCEPCQVEMSDLQAVYESYREDGLRVLAINLGEPVEAVRGWAQTMNLTFDLALDKEQSVAALYRLRGQPSTYVVSPQGIITHIFYGPTTVEALENALTPYISG